MSKITDIIAVIFDFDDTLVPDSTTKLLRNHGIDTDHFWGVQAKGLIDQGYDPPLAYLKLMLDNIGEGKPLGLITNQKLKEFGASLDGDFYRGLPEFFDQVREDVGNFNGIEVEYYIISGGLQAVLDGCGVVQKYFKGVYACQLAGETDDGVLRYIKRCVTFTEKTRYLFEINKGIDPVLARSKPQLVNKAIPEADRKIPFTNMIYVGDGMTDIPCFSLILKNHGRAFGVFDPTSKGKTALALKEFAETRRVTSIHSPKYCKDDDLGAILRSAIASLCLGIQSQRGSAFT